MSKSYRTGTLSLCFVLHGETVFIITVPLVVNSLMKTMPLASKVFFCISFYYCLFRIDYNLCYIHL
ncbi:hypothetical protein HMPREF9441_02806 [Paraprevotella clara YIT 11840]|uniref:Uncharacterized protein n=1 Tax=Paraprevotella clara YIT 11840 TaxID=762968 RepID=G5STV1_9BACT|nr:hypothetical protein HMPREF9441_02806 [Paraprevotella clara YIT 11840]